MAKRKQANQVTVEQVQIVDGWQRLRTAALQALEDADELKDATAVASDLCQVRAAVYDAGSEIVRALESLELELKRSRSA